MKPGSDGALALGMLHIIHRDGLADLEFINQHVQGYDQLVEETLIDFTPEKASEICGDFCRAYD